MSHTIAFIPARGGSKSIPLKNIKPLLGQPLILWSIQELLKVKQIDEVWVSTDSEDIIKAIEVVASEKLSIFHRDPKFAQDGSSTEDAMIEFINSRGLEDELFLLVQATSPFTRSDHFDKAIAKFHEGNYDSLLSGVSFKRFIWDKAGNPINYQVENRPRRQDFDGLFLENGAFYLSTVTNILKSKNRLSGKVGYYEMPEFTALEIDETHDWLIAEALIQKYNYQPEYSNRVKKQIKLFATDVDGVLTDAGMYYSEKGDELKKFNTRDGKGLELLRTQGVKTAIITSEDTQIVERRAKKLNVDYLYQGKMHQGKLDAIHEICKAENISLEEVAYIGDDVNCVEVLEKVGVAACPLDAVDGVRSIPGIHIMNSRGGEGCVREFTDLIIKQASHKP